MGSFNWIQSHQKILMKNTNKPRTKKSSRENVDLLVQKKSEAGLIGYQDNTLTHINDLITEKAKGQKNLDVGLSGILRNKNYPDVTSKISYQIFFCTNNSRKRFKKIIKK